MRPVVALVWFAACGLAACAPPRLATAPPAGASPAGEAAVPDSVGAAYLVRLEAAGRGGADREVAQLWPVLPADVRAEVGGSPETLAPDAGATLVSWWQAQDPLPVTAANERLDEHLARVAEAERRFPTPPRPPAPGGADRAGSGADRAGFDARGAVYVRFGEPVRSRRLRSPTLDTSGSPLADGAPDNAFWFYRRGLAFLFVEDRGRWRAASPLDLLPAGLRTPRSGNRATEWAALSALALQDFTRPLVLADPNYNRLMVAVDETLFDYTERATASGARAGRYATTFAAGERFYGASGSAGPISPAFFDLVLGEHRHAVGVRERSAAPSASAVPEVPGLAVALRTARFRDASGGLRVEVAWAPEPGAFDAEPADGAPSGRSVRSAAVLRDVGGPPRPDGATVRTAPLTAADTGPGRTTPAEVATLRSLGRRPLIAVQVDALDRRGAVLQSGVVRAGPLAPLRPGPGGLAVSDPLPHLVPPAAVALLGTARAGRARDRWRYPYDAVQPGAIVGVYVEAYDLGTEGGRSRYEVEREVAVLRDGARALVSRSATVSGTSSATAREFIVLPVPADVRPGERVELSGRLRDLVSGREGTWSLTFDVAGRGAGGRGGAD